MGKKMYPEQSVLQEHSLFRLLCLWRHICSCLHHSAWPGRWSGHHCQISEFGHSASETFFPSSTGPWVLVRPWEAYSWTWPCRRWKHLCWMETVGNRLSKLEETMRVFMICIQWISDSRRSSFAMPLYQQYCLWHNCVLNLICHARDLSNSLLLETLSNMLFYQEILTITVLWNFMWKNDLNL